MTWHRAGISKWGLSWAPHIGGAFQSSKTWPLGPTPTHVTLANAHSRFGCTARCSCLWVRVYVMGMRGSCDCLALAHGRCPNWRGRISAHAAQCTLCSDNWAAPSLTCVRSQPYARSSRSLRWDRRTWRRTSRTSTLHSCSTARHSSLRSGSTQMHFRAVEGRRRSHLCHSGASISFWTSACCALALWASSATRRSQAALTTGSGCDGSRVGLSSREAEM